MLFLFLIYSDSGLELMKLEFKYGRRHCTYLKHQTNAVKSNSELSVWVHFHREDFDDERGRFVIRLQMC